MNRLHIAVLAAVVALPVSLGIGATSFAQNAHAASTTATTQQHVEKHTIQDGPGHVDNDKETNDGPEGANDKPDGPEGASDTAD